MNARVVLEIANGPVTPDAHDRLRDAGIVVVPDILANAGGVTVSYFEWIQNRTGEYWSASRVRDALESRLAAAAGRVCDEADRSRVDLRDAAHVLALRRICGAIAEYGTREYFET